MNKIEFNVYLNALRQKGNLAYEYNPLHNYQTHKDLYIIDNKYIIPYDQAVNKKNGELREALGTLNSEIYGKENEPNGTGKFVPENQVRYYDLNSQGWRSFIAENLIDFE